MNLQWEEWVQRLLIYREMVTLGWIDSHLPLSGVAFNLLDLNLTGLKSKSEFLEKIREKAHAVAYGKWLIGMG